MKKIVILLTLGIVLVMTSSTLFGQTDPLWNYGSTMGASGVHNFATSSWNTTGEVCIVCHTPHNAYIIPGTDAGAGGIATPLWNHMISTQTFTLYSNALMKATVGQPDGNSLLCLSCHDGVTTENSFNGMTYGTPKTGGPPIGTNLTGTHPISFVYNTALAGLDNSLYDPSTALSGLTGNTTGTIATDLLFNGEVECCSCHDPHNNTTVKATEGGKSVTTQYLLRKPNSAAAGGTASGLCLTCHNF